MTLIKIGLYSTTCSNYSNRFYANGRTIQNIYRQLHNIISVEEHKMFSSTLSQEVRRKEKFKKERCYSTINFMCFKPLKYIFCVYMKVELYKNNSQWIIELKDEIICIIGETKCQNVHNNFNKTVYICLIYKRWTFARCYFS